MAREFVVPGSRKIGLGIDHLWLFGALAGFGILISLAPQPPNDFWWHLKAGQHIYSTGRIPQTNEFAWTLPADAPYVYGAWLADVLFYAFFRLGGLSLVLFIRTVLALIAFGLVGLEAYRKSASWRLAGVAAALAGLMTANNLIVRPQNWAWIPFIIFVIVLSAYADGRRGARWLLVCPLMMVFWVNVHGSFVLGLVLLLIFFLGEGLRCIWCMQGCRSWQEVGWIGVIGLLTVLATLLNAQGEYIFAYVIKMMTDQPSQMLIAEWQAPDPRDLGSLFFYISLILLIVVWSYKKYVPSPTETLSLLAFLWLAWLGVRYVVWFGMVAMPILARGMKDLLPVQFVLTSPAKKRINLALAAVFFVPFMLVQPWWIERMPLPASYWDRVWRATPVGPLISKHTPIKAVEYLKQHPGGKLFNEMGYGSYLIWALPEQGVFVDPRVELYPYELWVDYIKISSGVRYNLLLETYGADRLLLDVEIQGELIGLLESDPAWQREYVDPYTQIWRKRNTDSSRNWGGAVQQYHVDYIQSQHKSCTALNHGCSPIVLKEN